MDYLLILGGLAGFIIGLIALVKGSVRRLRLGSRKHGAWVMGISFVAVMAGGAIADLVDEVSEESSSEQRGATESVSPGGQTPRLLSNRHPDFQLTRRVHCRFRGCRGAFRLNSRGSKAGNCSPQRGRGHHLG